MDLSTKKVAAEGRKIQRVRKVKKVMCTRCGDRGKQPHNDLCRMCDTSYTGTWLLSYISEMRYIILDDDVVNGYAYGETSNDFLGLSNGAPIFVEVDGVDKHLFHASCDEKNMKEDDWVDEYDAWWQHPSVTKIDFRIDIDISPV